jgi:mono/diheme cytochrome c family protein
MKNNRFRSISTIAAVCFMLGAHSQSGAATPAANLVTICTSAHAITQASKCTAWQYNVYSSTAYIESYPQVSPGPKVWTDPAYEYRLGATITPTMGVKVCPIPLTPGTSFTSAAADPCPNNVLVSASTVIAVAPPPAAPAAPTFSLAAGTYGPRVITSLGLQGQPSVSLAEATPGATIHYTIDQSTPNLSSPTYSGPILLPIDAAILIQAIAFASGTNTPSALASAKYQVSSFPSDDAGFAETIPNLLTICTSATTTTQAAQCTRWQYNFYSPVAYIESYPQVSPGSKGFTDPAYEYRQGSSISGTMGIKTCPNGLLPGMSFSSTSADPCPENLLTMASLQIPSSTTLPMSSVFLYNNELERDSCTYYRTIGAETTPASSGPCKLNPDGSFVNGITQAQWLSSYFAPVASATGSVGASALFVNINDLNFVRDHHAVQTADGKASAAYVCNFPGPDFYHSEPGAFGEFGPTAPTAAVQASVDAAIQNALNGSNPLPCVAFDYGGAGQQAGQAYMRFLVFNPAGKLASAVDLDGRGPKQIPNACTACHGSPGPMHGQDPPEPSATEPEPKYQLVGTGYIPFDKGNFLFSSASGYTAADQEAQLKLLNQIVLNSATALDPGSPSTASVSTLIHGWYDTYGADGYTVTGSLTSPTQQFWTPPALRQAVGTNTPGALNEYAAYAEIYAPYCRSCHIANHLSSFFPPTLPGQLAGLFNIAKVCNPPTDGSLAVMPNSKASFDRFWSTAFGPAATGVNLPETVLQAFLSDTTCVLHTFQ